MRSAAKLLVVLAVLAAPPVALAAAGGHPGRVLAINCSRQQYKPAGIRLTCADAGIGLSSLHWTSWTRSAAHARGTFYWNDCKPDCADGHFHYFPVKVTLSQPRACPGHAHRGFARATFKFPAGHPPFRASPWGFACP